MIGHYAHEYEAGKVLPAPTPPGVLRADVSGFNRPETAPEISLQELTRDVVEAQHAGDASNALLSATQRGHDAGPMVRLQELLETSSQFASALETVRGRQVAARLSALGRQIEFLTREVEEAAEYLGATVAVLPPHRTPVLRVRPRPAVDTAPPTPPTRASTPARHRLGGALTGRLPNGMAPVAILLWASASGSSIAFGGLLCALYGLSSALAQPVKDASWTATARAWCTFRPPYSTRPS